MEESGFNLDDLDCLEKLVIMSEGFHKKDIYMFFTYDKQHYLCRLERCPEKNHSVIRIQKEIYLTKEEIIKKAEDLDDKLGDDIAVIIAEDSEKIFTGSFKQKIQLILLNYDFAGKLYDQGLLLS